MSSNLERWTEQGNAEVLFPFSGLSAHTQLVCKIHERCDLQCDPDARYVVKAVDAGEEGGLESSRQLEYVISPTIPGIRYTPKRAGPITASESLPIFEY